MNIHTFPLQRSTIEAFAEKHCLVMEVHERATHGPARFYAHFACCEVAERGMLVGVFGNGATPEDAIAEYGQRISGQRIVHRAGQPERKEISVPIIVTTGGEING